jgi:two-component system, LytTR family, sensor kinase
MMHQDFIQQQYRRFRNPKVRSLLLHTLFWVVWLSRNLYDVVGIWSWPWALFYALTIFISQAPLVYLHLYLIVPKFLNRQRFALYLLITGVLVCASSWINYYLLQVMPGEGAPESLKLFAQRIGWSFNILEAIIVVILTYALKYTLVAFLTQNELLRLQKEKLQLELRSLKAQVHPHFLFNTLNNLYSLTLKNSAKAGEMVLKLSDIMRYVLYEANEDQVSMEKEITFIRNYIELQRIRYSDKHRISFNVEGKISDQKVAPLLFIDFVENAFKHGLDKRFESGYVCVEFILDGDHLQFRVKNSASQSDEPGTEKQSGIGLQNVRRRLELIYSDRHNLAIKGTNEEFSVELKLELS